MLALEGLAGFLAVLVVVGAVTSAHVLAVFFGRKYLEGIADTARHQTLRRDGATVPRLVIATTVGPLQEQGTELLAREEPVLRKVIARYVRDDATVDDLFQEISIKVLRRIDTVRNPATLRGWLFQLARNACLDYLRMQDRRPKGSPASLPRSASTSMADRYLLWSCRPK